MILEIEVCLIENDNNCVSITIDSLKEKIKRFLLRTFVSIPLNHKLKKVEFETDICLSKNVDFINICDLKHLSVSNDKGFISLREHQNDVELVFYFFTMVTDIEQEQDHVDQDQSAPNLCSKTLLPAESLDGLWESLVFDEPGIKLSLLDYMKTALIFGDTAIDNNIIGINRVCLLHGPPGTGKTSLAKALAQKITIRMGSRYPSGGILVEINPNAIFSKYFSESAKVLLQMFNELHSLLDDDECFVCLLMDEVESLTSARKAAMNGNEPSDSIRVVNCLLTQIDKLKIRGNVLVVATSNITTAIDVAFLDRADIKQYIGPPGPCAVYAILRTAMVELMSKKLVYPAKPLLVWSLLPPPTTPFSMEQVEECLENGSTDGMSKVLFDLAGRVANAGISGRTLSKLLFLAYSRWLSLDQFTSRSEEKIGKCAGIALALLNESGATAYSVHFFKRLYELVAELEAHAL